MAVSLTDMLKPQAVGNDAGWTLAFHRQRPAEHWSIVESPHLVVGRDDYYAEIEAVLPSDFSGGKYTFVIEGMTDAHYRRIAADDVVRIYLYWRDSIASPAGYVASVGGLTDRLGDLSVAALKDFLVAELMVVKVSRRAGKRRYEATIEARERPVVLLRRRVLQKTPKATMFGSAAIEIAKSVTVPITVHGLTPGGKLPITPGAHPGDEKLPFEAGVTGAGAIATLADAIEAGTRKYGRGMVLIRDGRLHLGPRTIVDPARPPVELTHRTGLVESERDAPHRATSPEDSDDVDETGESGYQYRLTLKGRPDLKPGAVVTFRPAPEDQSTTQPASVLGAVFAGGVAPLIADEASGEPVFLYVNSVQHKLGRTSGFTTLLTGVELKRGGDGWDSEPPAGSATVPRARGHRGASASPAVGAAQKIRSVAQDAAAAARAPEVGEVRAGNTVGTGEGEEPPSQTVTLWRGLTQPDGRANQSRRLPIRRRNPAVFEGVAYASPFAWGLCGLVLPRYPGTRVLMVHRNGDPTDPVEVGALWESGQAPDSVTGDWWLILPAGILADRRGSLPDSQTAPEDWRGTVTNDLIDADGNRVIEVGEFTVRVGRLGDAGVRPKRAALERGVTIEHRDGEAKITIGEDGKIVIEATADLELVSKQGDIKLKAEKGGVDVRVANAMNVS